MDREMWNDRRRMVLSLATITLLLSACHLGGSDAPRSAGNEGAPVKAGSSHEIDPERVRTDVEADENFESPLRALCPRRIPDRIEERRAYPMIDLMHGLGYVAISDDSSHGSYEKVMEVTDAAMRDLGDDLEQDEDRYVVTLADREYVQDSEQYDHPPGRDDRVLVNFRWFWRPRNGLGERITNWTANTKSPELQGRATYSRTGAEWILDDVWVQSDSRDYMRR